MSYDVWIEPHPHPECTAPHTAPDSVNMTSNVAPVWRAAGCDLAEFDGRPVSALLPVLIGSLTSIEAAPHLFARHVRGDGTWGNVDSAIRFLREIRAACQAAPDGTVRVSW